MHGLFPHIHRSHPVCHFSCDHGRCQLLGNGVGSLLSHSHSEVAYSTVCGHLVESGWLILSQKAIPHKACVPVQSPFHKQLTEKRKDGRLFHLSTSKKDFQCFAVICRGCIWHLVVLFAAASRATLGPIEPFIQSVMGLLLLAVKRSEQETDYSSPFTPLTYFCRVA
jgi:hypothetical protein